MKAFSSASLIIFSQLTKILLGLFLMKAIALQLGTNGLGQLGHFISFITFLVIFSGGGIESGIVKYVSEYKNKPFQLISFLQASILYSSFLSFIIFLLLSLFSHQISDFIFNDSQFYYIIILISVIQFIMLYNKIIFSIANGYKDTKVYAYSQVIGNILSIPVIWWLITTYGFIGSMIAIVTNVIFASIPLYYFARKSNLLHLLKPKIKKYKEFTYLSHYSYMAIASALVFPLLEIFIRQLIITSSGYSDAGIWQAANKLSGVYVGFFALFLSYYFLPTVSPLKNNIQLQKIIIKYILVLGTLFLIFASAFYAGRNFFIVLLFSSEFESLANIIYLQLIGDFFKVMTFVIGFVYVAKAKVWFYICIEILQGILISFFTILLYSTNAGLEKIFQAYLISNIIFFIIMVIFIYKDLKQNTL